MDNTGAPQIPNHIKVFIGSKKTEKIKVPREAPIHFYSQNHIQNRAKSEP